MLPDQHLTVTVPIRLTFENSPDELCRQMSKQLFEQAAPENIIKIDEVEDS